MPISAVQMDLQPVNWNRPKVGLKQRSSGSIACLTASRPLHNILQNRVDAFLEISLPMLIHFKN